MTSAEILDILPHRYPFLMIDRVLDYDENTLTAMKNFTANEPYVQGHFPGNHIMPGVMMIEAMAQASTLLAFKYLQNNDLLQDFYTGNILFTAADQVRFKKVVVPGDQLIIHTKLIRHARKIFEFDAAALVDNITVSHGRLKAVAGLSM